MKKSDVNVQNLLNQLSEEKMNLVIDGDLRGGQSSYNSSKYSSRCTDSHSNSASECGGTGGGISIGGGVVIGVSGSGSLGIGL